MHRFHSTARRRVERFCRLDHLERRRLLSVELLKDINPGATGSSGNWHFELNGSTFFTADDGVHGNEQWISDGTPAGTRMLIDINPGSASSAPSWHTKIGNTVFFAADDGVHARELWKTDGTVEGTTMVADINPAGIGIQPTNAWLVAMNGILYFAGSDGTNGIELWRSDGTAAGTAMVANVHLTGSSSPQDLTAFGNRLVFSALDQTHGRELWVSDGTEAGTSLVKDINTIVAGSGTLSSTPNTFFELNGALLFRAVDTTSTGVELWRTDGTAAGTWLVKDINPSGSSQPNGYVPLNGFAYFAATTGSSDTELYRTDGTGIGTTLVKDIYPGTLPSSPSNLTPFNGELWFSAESSSTGRELWATDGTAANTRLMKDVRTGSGSSSPDWFTPFNDALYFTADDGTSGNELWRSDGTPAGTARVIDINTGTAASTPYLPRVANGSLYFFATTVAAGSEYWKLVPPRVTQFAYEVDARTLAVQFDQSVVASTLASNYTITQTPSGATFLVQSVTYDAATHTARFTTATPLPDGNYTLSLSRAAVTDAAGNRLAGTNAFDFFVLTGDVNRDRHVNFDDLLILAQNYGQSGRTFSQGNINYSADGKVDFDDLLLLAQRYGTAILNAPLRPARNLAGRGAHDVLGGSIRWSDTRPK